MRRRKASRGGVRRKIDEYDDLPSEWKALVQEFDLAAVLMFRDNFGVTDTVQLRHLLETHRLRIQNKNLDDNANIGEEVAAQLRASRIIRKLS